MTTTLKVNMNVIYGVKTPWEKLDEWQQKANQYTCTLKYQGRQLTTNFFTGTGWTKEPTWKDVLGSLINDARCFTNSSSFEDFCDELGYDSNSRKALKIYKDCKRTNDKLIKFLGDDLNQFEEMLSEY